MTEANKRSPKFNIVALNYVTMYIKDYEAAIQFYTHIFGPADNITESFYGWRMGTTWLTLFPSKDGTHKDSNPRNAEFAIQVSSPEEVDRLHTIFIEAGAKNAWTPEDTEMYEAMRFSCVDDPFGMRIDIYCPINHE